MRSLLFVPAYSPRKIEKAQASPADVIILDLEDSVSPDDKPAARATAARVLRERAKTGTQQIYVRINPLGSGFERDDLAEILPAAPDGLMQPKTVSAADVETLRELVPGDLALIAIATETAGSLFNLGTYASLSPPLAGLTWGAEDLSNELGALTSRDDNGRLTGPYALARTLCLAGARAAACEPIDTVCVNFSDPQALEAECRAAMRDGFTGKMAIHPNQVDTINRVFTPSPSDVHQAQAIVDAFEAAGQPGVIAVDGKMYDRPHLERAKRLLTRARSYGA